MSLNWDISEVKDVETKKRENWGVIESLIWSSLTVGLSKITENNLSEWVYRLNRMQLEYGEPCTWTVDNIHPYIGLKTNVSTLTPTEFESIIKKNHSKRFHLTRKDLEK